MRWALLFLLFGAMATANPPQPAPPPVYLNTYGARFMGEPDPTLKEILVELRKLNANVEALRGTQVPAEPRPLSLKALVTARCAGCHSEKVAATKGGDFVLLDAKGQVVPLSVAEKKRIVREVTADRMPKVGGLLSEVEKNALQEFLFPKEDGP